MRSGDLSVRLAVLEPQKTRDADGQVIQSYSERGKVWANVRHRPGSEAFQAARMEARNPATVAVRASSLTRQIASDWRVESATMVFDVKGDPFLSEDRAFVIFQVEGRRK